MLEGEWTPKRVVILEFPDIARLKAWYRSPEYRPLMDIRKRTTKGDFVVIDGV